MADIDPKEILSRNIPLVVIYVLALAPIGVWFGVMSDIKSGKRNSFKAAFNKLRSKASQVNRLDGQIKAKDPNNPVFTKGHVEAFQKRKEALVKQNDALAKLVAERDKALKVWFPEKWKDKAWSDPPEYTEYAEYWKETAIPKLKEEFKDIVTSDDPGAEAKLFGTAGPPGRNKMKEGQKKFWIQKAILTALKEGGKTRTPRLNNVPVFSGTEAGGAPPKADDGSLYSTIGCQFDITGSLRDLPLILHALLAQKLPMQVTGLQVNKVPFRYARPWKQGPNEPALVDGAEAFFQEYFYSAQLQQASDFKQDQEAYIPEPPVRMVIKVEVFDFHVKQAAAQPPKK